MQELLSSIGSGAYRAVYATLSQGGEPWLAILFETAIKGAVLLAAAGLAASALRGAAMRHLVWALALASLLLLPAFAALLPTLDLPVPAPAASTSSEPVRRAPPRPVRVAATLAPRALEVERDGVAVAAALPGPGETAVGQPAARPWTTPESRAGGSTGAWALAVWAAGFLLSLVTLFRGVIERRRLARAARPVEDADWRALAAELATRLGIRRPPRLWHCAGAAVPMTWGVWRPVILLPADADRWTARRRSDVLLHELAHVRRHDYLTQLSSRLVCALHWFQPLAWIAAHRLRVESEHACDDLVLGTGSRASDYADHLLAAARSLRGRLPAATVAMARTSKLSGRILAILDETRDRSPLSARRLLLAILAACLLALPLAAAAPSPYPPLPEPPEVPSAPEAPEAPAAPEVPEAPPAPPATEVPSAPEVPPVPEAPPTPPTMAPPTPAAAEAPSAPEPPLAPEPVVWPMTEALPAPEAPPAPVAPVVAQGAPVVASLAPAVPVAAAFAAAPSGQSVEIHDETPPSFRERCGEGGLEKSIHGRNGDYRVEIEVGRCRLEIEMRGDVAWNRVEDGVESMGRRAYLEIDERIGRDRRRVEITPGSGGRPEIRWYVDGRELPAGEETRSWMRQALPLVFRATGIDAEARVGRILARSGPEGVLAEVPLLLGDHVQRIYLEQLLEQHTLAPDLLQRALRLAGGEIGSDFELAELLTRVPAAELRDSGPASPSSKPRRRSARISSSAGP